MALPPASLTSVFWVARWQQPARWSQEAELFRSPRKHFPQRAPCHVPSLHPGLWPSVTFSRELFLTSPPKKASSAPHPCHALLTCIIFLCDTAMGHYTTYSFIYLLIVSLPHQNLSIIIIARIFVCFVLSIMPEQCAWHTVRYSINSSSNEAPKMSSVEKE